MKKINIFLLTAYCWIQGAVYAANDKFEILPDLPEPLAAAQASSVSTNNENSISLGTQANIQEPNLISVVFSLLFVILLIYAAGIVYAKINRASLNTLKRQIGDVSSSKACVVSTTPLGNNKTLHVVELDGKRMLIGASTNSIQLIKDLGSISSSEISEGEFSKIEIPNIRIPKIEIPKIEFPNIGFTKAFNKTEDVKQEEKSEEELQTNDTSNEDDKFVISDIYEESDGIIDKLFHTNANSDDNETENEQQDNNTHRVDPDEYALYKKYL